MDTTRKARRTISFREVLRRVERPATNPVETGRLMTSPAVILLTAFRLWSSFSTSTILRAGAMICEMSGHGRRYSADRVMLSPFVVEFDQAAESPSPCYRSTDWQRS